MNVAVLDDNSMQEPGKILEVGRLHAEAGHFLHPHPEGAGGGKAFLLRRGLVVDDDVVGAIEKLNFPRNVDIVFNN